MPLKPRFLEMINTTPARLQIAQALGVSERTVSRYIAERSDDLTKFKALEVIKKITGVLEYGELIE